MTAPEALFLPAGAGRGGQRFCLLHAPLGPVRGAIAYVHPLAEEMNKSRRMAALQSRAFADAGYAVLQIDLSGCGDSSGDFGDATWADWLADVRDACRWLQGRWPSAPLWLWGLRAGCLIAAEAAAGLDAPCHLLLWQAPASGKLLLQQFLRLKVVGAMQDGSGKGVMDTLKRQLAAGSHVDVAGYRLSPSVAAGFEASSLQRPVRGSRVEWIELSTRDDASLLPASIKTLGAWREAGVELRSQVVHGPAFWQTVEIGEAPALLAASVTALAAAETVAA